MNNDNKVLKPIQFIRELCKEKTQDDLLETEKNFREFLLVIKEIADRLEVEDKTLEDFDN
jgi:isochorismate synthase EntC